MASENNISQEELLARYADFKINIYLKGDGDPAVNVSRIPTKTFSIAELPELLGELGETDDIEQVLDAINTKRTHTHITEIGVILAPESLNGAKVAQNYPKFVARGAWRMDGAVADVNPARYPMTIVAVPRVENSPGARLHGFTAKDFVYLGLKHVAKSIGVNPVYGEMANIGENSQNIQNYYASMPVAKPASYFNKARNISMRAVRGMRNTARGAIGLAGRAARGAYNAASRRFYPEKPQENVPEPENAPENNVNETPEEPPVHPGFGTGETRRARSPPRGRGGRRNHRHNRRRVSRTRRQRRV